MGLGPPVCQHCQVLAAYEPYPHGNGWYCQYCGETKITGSAGMDLNSDYYKQFINNEKFYKFVKGE